MVAAIMLMWPKRQTLPLIVAGSSNLNNVLTGCCCPNQALSKLGICHAGVECRDGRIQKLDPDASFLCHDLQDKTAIQLDSHKSVFGGEARENLQRRLKRDVNGSLTWNIWSICAFAVKNVHNANLA